MSDEEDRLKMAASTYLQSHFQDPCDVVTVTVKAMLLKIITANQTFGDQSAALLALPTF